MVASGSYLYCPLSSLDETFFLPCINFPVEKFQEWLWWPWHGHVPSSHWTKITAVGSKALKFCPYWTICSSVGRKEGGVNVRMEALPLDPVAKEGIRGKVLLADTSLVAGTSLELESHSNLCQWKIVLEEHLEKCEREVYQFGCIKKISSLNNTLWLAHNSVGWQLVLAQLIGYIPEFIVSF